MSHNVETMAFAGELPWHGLGVAVSEFLSAEEMMKAAHVDWTVSKAPLFARVEGEEINLPEMALVRDSDRSILDVVGADWEPNQNSTAFEFFKEFVDAGNMKMHTAGSLQKGKIVWALAKVDKEFTLFNGDKVDGHLLFSNPHKYGMSIDVRFTAVRVVCNNTLTFALNGRANQVFKSSHRVKLDPQVIKETLGLAEKRMDQYKDLATFLGSKKFTLESVGEYFDEVFPSMSAKGVDKKNRNAKQAQAALDYQPGMEFAPGSWWQALNAATFVTNHAMGRTADTRVNNLWYGSTQQINIKAMQKALEYAKAA